MIVYRELHPLLHGLMPVILMGISQLALLCVMIAFRDRHRVTMRLISLALFILAAGFQLVCMRMERKLYMEPAEYAGEEPAAFLVALLAALLIFLAVEMRHLIRWHRSHITQESIQESIDYLPAGLCFYGADGRIFLVNYQMKELCRQICGEELTNGIHFWQHLRQAGEHPILRMPDGTVYSFTRRIRRSGYPVCELKAMDVTRQYELSMEIAEENKMLQAMNERLRIYGETAEAVAREREMLEARIHIHDSLGQLLLAARYALQHPEAENEAQRRQLVTLWQQNLGMLWEGNPPTQDAYEDLADIAETVGVSIFYDGSLPPEDSREGRVLARMIHECLTNTVSHADGTELYVRVRSRGDGLQVTCRNNGKPPEGPIREGGGLSGVRRSVEGMGGTVEIVSEPEFQLTATLPSGAESSRRGAAEYSG
jgi:signal transduction histidine kinase